MKKLALILAMVCFVLSFSFAQEYKPEVSVSGSAKLMFGFNLDKSIFGWKSSADAGLVLKLVPKATVNKTGEKMYGFIELKDFEMKVDGTLSSSAPKISAKLAFDPLWIKFANEAAKGDITKNFTAGNFSLTTLDDFPAFVASATTVKVDSPTANYLEMGASFAPVDLVVKAVTDNNYCAATDPANDFWIGVNPKVTLGDLVVEANSIFAIGVDNYKPAFGAKATYSLKLNDQFTLKPAVGFDMILRDATTDAEWSAGGGVYLTWAGESTFGGVPGTNCAGWSNYDGDDKTNSGVGVGFSYSENEDVDVVVQAAEASGDDGILPGLGFAAQLGLGNVTKTMAMGVEGYVTYAMGDVSLYGGFMFKDKNAAFVAATATVPAQVFDNGSLAIKVGATVAKILPNTELNVEYRSQELMAVAATNTVQKTNGLALATVKVSF